MFVSGGGDGDDNNDDNNDEDDGDNDIKYGKDIGKQFALSNRVSQLLDSLHIRS